MSYFDHPVRVAVFQTAVVGLVERLIRKAGRTEDVRIQVLFTGETACAVWSNTGRGIRGTIKLPALKANSVIDRAKANRWVAYVIHETWHVVFTSWEQWQQFAGTYPGLRTFLANAVEDARIERSGMELGYADGFKVVGRELLTAMMEEGGMDVNPNDPRQIPWVFAMGCRGYGVKGEARLLSALDPRVRVILDECKRRCDAIPAEIPARIGTKLSCDIALWAYEELKKLGREPALPPRPPDGPDGFPGDTRDNPAPQEDRPKSTDDSEREAGDASDETYDDEGDPQEREGTKGKGQKQDAPLRVGDKVVCPDGSKGVITAIVNDDATVAAL
jgi:hypothetical protein